MGTLPYTVQKVTLYKRCPVPYKLRSWFKALILREYILQNLLLHSNSTPLGHKNKNGAISAQKIQVWGTCCP